MIEDLIVETGNLNKNYVKFWGTRGSISVAGNSYDIYGGNTACLEIRSDNNIIILDAGTGIRKLGYEVLKQKNKDIHLFISHFHWDHILGFPFFLPVYCGNYNIHIYAPGESEDFIRKQFEILLKPEFFPVGLTQMSGKLIFHCLRKDSVIEIGKVKISCCPANHPGNTFCFRIGTPTFDFGYVTDNEFVLNHVDTIPETGVIDFENNLAEVFKNQVDFFKGCKIMVHEAQYFDEAYLKKVGWGHSSLKNASILMNLIHPEEWIITHHDPEDIDDLLNVKYEKTKELLKKINFNCKLTIAKEGMTINI